jgi:hypothetical protein
MGPSSSADLVGDGRPEAAGVDGAESLGGPVHLERPALEVLRDLAGGGLEQLGRAAPLIST